MSWGGVLARLSMFVGGRSAGVEALLECWLESRLVPLLANLGSEAGRVMGLETVFPVTPAEYGAMRDRSTIHTPTVLWCMVQPITLPSCSAMSEMRPQLMSTTSWQCTGSQPHTCQEQRSLLGAQRALPLFPKELRRMPLLKASAVAVWVGVT